MEKYRHCNAVHGMMNFVFPVSTPGNNLLTQNLNRTITAEIIFNRGLE